MNVVSKLSNPYVTPTVTRDIRVAAAEGARK